MFVKSPPAVTTPIGIRKLEVVVVVSVAAVVEQSEVVIVVS